MILHELVTGMMIRGGAILARPDSFAYRAIHFTRRYRSQISGMALGLFTSVLSVIAGEQAQPVNIDTRSLGGRRDILLSCWIR